MKTDPNESHESRQAHMTKAAENAYGSDRTDEIASQIEHLARMMTRIAGMSLDLRDQPLPGPIDRNRGAG